MKQEARSKEEEGVTRKKEQRGGMSGDNKGATRQEQRQGRSDEEEGAKKMGKREQ